MCCAMLDSSLIASRAHTTWEHCLLEPNYSFMQLNVRDGGKIRGSGVAVYYSLCSWLVPVCACMRDLQMRQLCGKLMLLGSHTYQYRHGRLDSLAKQAHGLLEDGLLASSHWRLFVRSCIRTAAPPRDMMSWLGINTVMAPNLSQRHKAHPQPVSDHQTDLCTMPSIKGSDDVRDRL